MTDINEMIEVFKTFKDKLAKEVKDNLHSAFAPAFEKYVNVEAFGFTAYTPYFNDGDPCEYMVQDLEVFLREEGEEEAEVTPYDGYSTWSLKRNFPDSELSKDFQQLANLIGAIPDEIMNAAFGEGFIVIKRDGIEVEDYDHD